MYCLLQYFSIIYIGKKLVNNSQYLITIFYMLSFLAKIKPKYRIRSVYSYFCVRGPYPQTDGKGHKSAIGWEKSQIANCLKLGWRKTGKKSMYLHMSFLLACRTWTSILENGKDIFGSVYIMMQTSKKSRDRAQNFFYTGNRWNHRKPPTHSEDLHKNSKCMSSTMPLLKLAIQNFRISHTQVL
jgi:hypothetical protein